MKMFKTKKRLLCTLMSACLAVGSFFAYPITNDIFPRYINGTVADAATTEEQWFDLNPDFSPDSAAARLEKYLSRADYEALFPYRYGSPKCKEQWAKNEPAPETAGLSQAQAAKEDDYYSYDNLIAAMKEIADIKLKIEFRINTAKNETVGYASRTSMLRKSSGETTVLYETEGFMEENLMFAPVCVQFVDLGAFLAEGSENDKKREIAALFANMTQETSGRMNIDSNGNWGTISVEASNMLWGLYWKEEVSHIGDDTALGYVSAGDKTFPPTPGQSYHGRGPIQLSWNYNYGRESLMFFNDKQVLLDDPDMVLRDGKLGFMTVLAFWMTPDEGKPSCHDVMVGNWTPNANDISAGRDRAGMPMTIMIINGGLEGNCDMSDSRVALRVNQFKNICKLNGADISKDGDLTTFGMKGATAAPFVYNVTPDNTQPAPMLPGESMSSYTEVWSADKEYGAADRGNIVFYKDKLYRFTGWYGKGSTQAPDIYPAVWTLLGDYQDPASTTAKPTTTTTKSATTTTTGTTKSEPETVDTDETDTTSENTGDTTTVTRQTVTPKTLPGGEETTDETTDTDVSDDTSEPTETGTTTTKRTTATRSSATADITEDTADTSDTETDESTTDTNSRTTVSRTTTSRTTATTEPETTTASARVTTTRSAATTAKTAATAANDKGYYGDLDVDGRIDILDVVILQLFIVNPKQDQYTIYENWNIVNWSSRGAEPTVVDLVILKQFLAGWNPTDKSGAAYLGYDEDIFLVDLY